MRDRPDEGKAGLADQFAEVLSGIGRLLQGELRLARAEAVDGLRGIGAGLARLVLAVVVGLVALNVLAGAAVAALVEAGLGPVWAALVVGLGLALVALALALWGRAALRLNARRPDRALRSLRRDAEALRSGLTAEGRDDG